MVGWFKRRKRRWCVGEPQVRDLLALGLRKKVLQAEDEGRYIR